MGKQRCPGDKDLLPEADLIRIILLRLPIVSLLRFKFVCKSWESIIIDLHATTNTSKFGLFILHAAVDCQKFRENALLMLSSVSESEYKCVSGSLGGRGGEGGGSSNDNNDSDQQQQLVLKLDNLGFPSCYQFDKTPIVMVVGSCNGLICLYAEQPKQVSLWNPVTRQFRILPKPITNAAADSNNVHRLFAFGFDDETKDYKVVLLSVFNRRMLNYVVGGPVAMECLCRVQVYSLSTDSWRLLEGITSLPGSPFPYPPDSSSELFYLNGCCFFMAKLLYSSEQCTPPSPKLQDRFIISLDLTKETITPIKLPNHHYLQHLNLCYLGMKIALFIKTYTYTDDVINDPTGSWESFQIWVFNEPRSSSVDNEPSSSSVDYESRSSSVDYEPWTQVQYFQRLGLPGEQSIPRGISDDGVFAFLETEIHGGLGNKKERKKMELYNLVTKEMKMNFLTCDQVLSKAYAYKPSSVSIIGKGGGC